MDYINYLILIAVVIYGAWYFYTKVLPRMREAKDILSNYRMDKNSTLSEKEQRMLAIGAATCEYLLGFHNTLALGESRRRFVTIYLNQRYNLQNTEEVRREIEFRLSGQFASLIPIIYGAAKLEDGTKRKDFLHDAAGDNKDLYEYLLELTKDLLKQLPELKRLAIQNDEDVLKYGAVGFDAEQAVILARCAFDLGYINEREAWDYIERANAMVSKSSLSSWADFGKSYIIGRSLMWDSLDAQDATVKLLLEQEKSPWMRLAW
ncbi:MAG: hypothetical protein CSA07_00455 [Bacteroidia bacterium]|nr:MAG: hypothetical protein CSA07_00455 [Bacteroidia bacterium]